MKYSVRSIFLSFLLISSCGLDAGKDASTDRQLNDNEVLVKACVLLGASVVTGLGGIASLVKGALVSLNIPVTTLEEIELALQSKLDAEKRTKHTWGRRLVAGTLFTAGSLGLLTSLVCLAGLTHLTDTPRVGVA